MDECKPLPVTLPSHPFYHVVSELFEQRLGVRSLRGPITERLSQGLTLVHHSPQREHFWRDTTGKLSDEMAQVEPKMIKVDECKHLPEPARAWRRRAPLYAAPAGMAPSHAQQPIGLEPSSPRLRGGWMDNNKGRMNKYKPQPNFTHPPFA